MVDFLVIGDRRLTMGGPSINNQQPLIINAISNQSRQSTMLI
jgi:hypothetical protein